MSLHRLIYVSSMMGNCSQVEIEQIMDSARRHNLPAHITGFLCFANGFFLQILEGSRSAVSETFCRIAQDPRHHNIMILDCSPIAERQFADWAMGYAGETKANRFLFCQFSEHDSFAPYELTRENAYHLLLNLADTLRTNHHLAVA